MTAWSRSLKCIVSCPNRSLQCIVPTCPFMLSFCHAAIASCLAYPCLDVSGSSWMWNVPWSWLEDQPARVILISPSGIRSKYRGSSMMAPASCDYIKAEMSAAKARPLSGKTSISIHPERWYRHHVIIWMMKSLSLKSGLSVARHQFWYIQNVGISIVWVYQCWDACAEVDACQR